MKRATSFLAVVFAMASCHSPLIIVERSSSGAVERPFEFSATPGADKHFISLPAYPFVNCLDVLKTQSPVLSKRTIQATPCADSLESAGFTGSRITA